MMAGAPGACSICAAWWISLSSIRWIRRPCTPTRRVCGAARTAANSWNLVYPSPSAVKGVKMNSDHSDEQILADPDPLSTIAALAVDPSNSQVLYVAAGTKESPALFVSRDYGKSWKKQVNLPDVPRRIWVDPHSAANARTLFLASHHTIAVSQRRRRAQPSRFRRQSATFPWALVRASQPIIYATSEQGIFVSERWWRDLAQERSAGRGRRKCAPSLPACIIRRRRTSPTII